MDGSPDEQQQMILKTAKYRNRFCSVRFAIFVSVNEIQWCILMVVYARSGMSKLLPCWTALSEDELSWAEYKIYDMVNVVSLKIYLIVCIIN